MMMMLMYDEDTNVNNEVSRAKIRTSCVLEYLPDNCLISIFSFFVCPNNIDIDSFLVIQSVSTRIHKLLNSHELWYSIPLVSPSTQSFNLNAFRLKTLKNQGTEGKCYKAFSRRNRKEYAIKRARVYPDFEGIPYYMMREIAALKKINHINICPLEFVHLNRFKLFLVFPYVDLTLCDLLPTKDSNCANHQNHSLHDESYSISKPVIQHIMKQVFSAVAYCHSRGIIHRNIKPKHLLVIPGSNPNDKLEGCTIQLADFALARILDHPPHAYTSEVITLWYRPPEILMGKKNYTAAVDVWSCGCILAELLQGRPLFLGLCEIDQLLQIFFKLGLPKQTEWEEFITLPHFQEEIFPNWDCSRLKGILHDYADDNEFNLVECCLHYNPLNRVSAIEALSHAYFKSMNTTTVESNIELCYKIPHPDLINLHKTTLSQHEFFRQLETKRPPYILSSDSSYSSLSYSSSSLSISPNSTTGNTPIKISMSTFYNPANRQDIMVWLISIMDIFQSLMSSRTIYFAVALVDTYLLTIHETTSLSSHYHHPNPQCISELRLIAATCLYIASKCEDVSHIGISNLAFTSDINDNNFESSHILVTEESILSALDFNIYIPTTIDFIHIYNNCVPEMYHEIKCSAFCKYLAEICLINWQFLKYPSSRLATSICIYALVCFNLSPFPTTLQSLSFYKYNDLYDCVKVVQQAHYVMTGRSSNIVYKRYAKQENHKVALISARFDIPAFV